MTHIKDALEDADVVLHKFGNSLNTVLHSCYEDAGVSPEHKKTAVDDLIKGYAELKIIIKTIRDNY